MSSGAGFIYKFRAEHAGGYLIYEGASSWSDFELFSLLKGDSATDFFIKNSLAYPFVEVYQNTGLLDGTVQHAPLHVFRCILASDISALRLLECDVLLNSATLGVDLDRVKQLFELVIEAMNSNRLADVVNYAEEGRANILLCQSVEHNLLKAALTCYVIDGEPINGTPADLKAAYEYKLELVAGAVGLRYFFIAACVAHARRRHATTQIALDTSTLARIAELQTLAKLV